MNNIELAKQLYINCDNTDPKQSTLMPVHFFKEIYTPLLVGKLVNAYANEDCLKDDWVIFNKQNFYMGKWDKEGWTNAKRCMYKLEKKGFIESKFENNQNYVRLISSLFYDREIYKRKELTY